MASDPLQDISMDGGELYREEVFTDRRVGTIQRLTPVDGDGNADPNREVIYMGQTQVLTPAGGLPVSFEIPANSLGEAAKAFGDQAREALADTMRKLEEMRREAAGSIIVPETGAAAQMPPGAGGKIRMP